MWILRVLPRDQLAVHPDLLGRRDGHDVSDLLVGCAQSAAAIASPIWVVVPVTSSECRDGLLDAGRGVRLAEELAHHRGRDDRRTRIGGAGARDVGRRAVHRLEQRRAGAGRIEVGRRGASDAAGDRAAEVGEDVAEQVVGDDHVVAAGILDEVDARGVDVVVARWRRRRTRRRPRRTCAARGRRRT